MNILVIGGSGYIGSRLCDELSQAGLLSTSYGNKSLDYNNLSIDFLKNYEYIILLAGHSSVPSCNGDLKSPWNNNVRNFANLIEKLSNNQKLIYASSASVYGNSFNKECTEADQSFSYINNYDLTKLVIDQIASNYISLNKKIIGLRFGTVCGRSTRIRRDILINSMTYSAVETNKIQIENPNIYRPFLSISDLCNGILTIIQSKFIPGIYNMANGNYKIVEYAQAVSRNTGAGIVDNGTSFAYDFRIDNSKFIRDYKFKYKDSLDNIINELVATYKSKSSKIVTCLEYFQYNH